MKCGIECEGRFKGLRTILLNATEFKHNNVKEFLTKNLQRFQQLYITDERNVLTEEDFNELYVMQQDYLVTVTIEIRSVSDDLKGMMGYFHIVLGIETIDPFYLKDTDQVKVYYKNNVLQSPVCMMIKTFPEEFLDDEEIKWEGETV